MINELYKSKPVIGPVMRPKEAARYIGVSVSCFYSLIKSGEIPPLIKLTGRASGIPKPWLDAWLSLRFEEEQKPLLKTETQND